MTNARTTTVLGLAVTLLACGDDVAPMTEGSTSEPGTSGPASTSSGSSTGELATTTDEGSTTSAGSSSESGDATTLGGSESTDGETEGTTGDPPVCPPVPYTAIRGATVGGLAGWQVAGAGDFDGDGVGDYAISTPRADAALNTDSGRVHIIRGGPRYEDFNLGDVGTRIPGWVVEGEATNHRAGDAVTGLGDVNGDGRDDLLISSDVREPALPPEERGRWSVVHGVEFDSVPTEIRLSDVRDGTGGFAVDGRASAFSTQPARGHGVGDVNVDGLDDILLGAPLLANLLGPSAVDIIFGRQDNPGHWVLGASGPAPGEGLEFANEAAWHGFIVGGGGDINGDGIPDVVFGTNDQESTTLHVMFGGRDIETTTLDDIAMGVGGFEIDLALPDSLFTLPGTVDIVGDVNGDGFDDIGFNVTYPLPDMDVRAGIGIIFGRPNTDPMSLLDVFDGVGGFISTRPEGDRDRTLGFNVGAAGDINDDGYADVFVARGADPLDGLGGENVRGRLYVAYGREGMDALDLETVAGGREGFVFDSPTVNDDFAQSITGGQDVNGDDIPDVLIGAPQDGQFGTVYLLYGFNETCPQVR